MQIITLDAGIHRYLKFYKSSTQPHTRTKIFSIKIHGVKSHVLTVANLPLSAQQTASTWLRSHCHNGNPGSSTLFYAPLVHHPQTQSTSPWKMSLSIVQTSIYVKSVTHNLEVVSTS